MSSGSGLERPTNYGIRDLFLGTEQLYINIRFLKFFEEVSSPKFRLGLA